MAGINFATKQLIILYYPGMAGGKFLGNCLALSRHAVMQQSFIAELDLNFNNEDFKTQYKLRAQQDYRNYALPNWPNYNDFLIGNYSEAVKQEMEKVPYRHRVFSKLHKLLYCDSYRDFKKTSTMQTIPQQQSLMTNWFQYEVGCHQLFGISNDEYDTVPAEEIKQKTFNDIIAPLSNSNRYFFLVAHHVNRLEKFLAVWPQAQVIQLTNYEKFRYVATELKFPNWIDSLNGHVPEPIFTGSTIVDVDSTYFDQDVFLESISNLYNILKFDDFDRDLVLDFYTAYIRLHETQHNI
jgi:hypothetical protein